ncbi:hypothetical protein TELCIR_17510, partial [Teladorsagia circumcincta]
MLSKSFDERQHDHRQREVDRTNSQMKLLYMGKSFRDPRLSLINCSIVPSTSICAGVEYMVVVHMRADDALSRSTWRNTYGNPHLKDKYNYNLLFSVGRPSSLSDQKIIEEESSRHGDILQTDFEENYRNITLKHLAELRYLASVCNERVVVIKMDDDVGWDVRQISAFIRNNLTSHDIYCTRFL